MKKLFPILLLLVAICQLSFSQNQGVTILKCRMYKNPYSFKIVQRIDKGETITILGEEKIYYKATYNNQTGFIEKDAIEAPEPISVKEDATSMKQVERYKYEIDHIRYCMGKYGKQKSTAYLLQIVGGISTGIGAGIDDENSEYLIFAGAACGIVGLIMHIDAQKWMKRAHLGPSDNGFGIKYRF